MGYALRKPPSIAKKVCSSQLGVFGQVPVHDEVGLTVVATNLEDVSFEGCDGEIKFHSARFQSRAFQQANPRRAAVLRDDRRETAVGGHAVAAESDVGGGSTQAG